MKKQAMQYIKNITTAGMKGRKKETKLNKIILTMVFFMFAGAVIVLSSFLKTQKEQRLDDYGEWKVAEYSILSETKPLDFSDLKMGQELVGKIELCGVVLSTDYVGVTGIGKISNEVKRTGRIQLQEGSWPKKDNEVAVEVHVLNQLNLSYEIGQKITIPVLQVPKDLQVSLEQVVVVPLKGKKYKFFHTETREPLEGCKIIEKQFVISGVIKNYSDIWAAGRSSFLPGIVLSNGSDTLQMQEYHLFYSSSQSVEEIQEKFLKHSQYKKLLEKNLVVNTYAEETNQMQLLLNVIVIGLIFVIAVYSVFQTFATQLKKRTKRICLLKSIGATDEQICSMLIQEALLLLRFAAPLGIVSGVAGGMICMLATGKVQERQIYLSCNILLFLVAIMAGFLSVLIGLFLPVKSAMHVPLIGNIQLHVPKNIKRKKTLGRRRQTFLSITLRHHSVNKMELLLSFGMAMLAGIFVSLSFFSVHFQFTEYERMNKEQAPYAVAEIHQKENPDLRFINAVPGVDYSIGTWRTDVDLAYENIGNSPILKRERKIWNENRAGNEDMQRTDYESYFSSLPNTVRLHIKDTASSKVYRDMYAVTEENLGDWKEFAEGKQVLVYIPNYRYETQEDIDKIIGMYGRNDWEIEYSDEKTEITYAQTFYLTRTYKSDVSLQVGDTITLTDIDGKQVQTIVGGIIRYTENMQANGYEKVFYQPYDIIAASSLSEAFCDGKYSSINIYTNEKSGYKETDKKLANILQNTTWFNFRLEQEELWERAVYRAVLLGTVGIAAILIVLCIQFHNVKAKLSQEEKRIGILRSMGITKKKMAMTYFAEGILHGISALSTGILTFFICVILKGSVLVDISSDSIDIAGSSWTMFSGGYITFAGYWKETMEGYPVGLHIIAGIVLFFVLIAIQVIPLKKALRKNITENIRELGE